MPLVAQHPDNAARLREAVRIQQQIRKLEERLTELLGDQTGTVRSECALTEAQMKKAARNLHARAKKRIAEGRCKEFKGDIEAIL